MDIITERLRQRQRIVEYAMQENNNAKAAVKYNTTRQFVKYWRDRYDGTLESLKSRSKRPHNSPRAHTEKELKLIMEMYKKHKRYGYAEVYVRAKEKGYTRSFSSMCNNIRKLKKNEPEKEKNGKPQNIYQVPEVKYPGELVQVDIKYIPMECILFGPMSERRYYQITAIDVCTRKRILDILVEKSTFETTKFIMTLEQKLGFKIKTIQTDNGREFTNEIGERESLFTKTLRELGITHKKSSPHSPWQNGYVERSHRGDSVFYANKTYKSLKSLKRSVVRHYMKGNRVAKKVLNFMSPEEMLQQCIDKYQDQITIKDGLISFF